MKENDVTIKVDKAIINTVMIIIIGLLITITVTWNSSISIIVAIISGYWGYMIGSKKLPNPNN